MTIAVNEQEEVVELGEGEAFADLSNEVIEEVVEEELEEAVVSYQIPDKFKDKSIEDIAKSYEQLESEMGRKASEVGELRKLSDQLLNLQLEEKQEETTQPKELDVDALLENPTEAINAATDARFKQLEDQFTQVERNKGKAQFEAHHPDSQELLNDPNFIAHIQGNAVRTRMFQEAHANFDYNTADALFSEYKELHGTAKEEAQEKATQKRTKKLKAAKTETGSTGARSTKVYRRADLINLRMHDRDRYEAMSDEITRAYAEGRVK